MISAYAALKARETLQPFSYKERALEPYEVLLEVHACGVCHSDIHLIDDDWKVSIYPLVPGHEIVGEVIKLGSAVKNTKLGERVGVGYTRASCLSCDFCLSGNENLCGTRSATCNGNYGGFAEKTIADSRFIYPIPKKLGSASAAPLLCAGATVYSPLRRFKMQANNRVGVMGIGGLGHLGIQFARAFGCHTVALSSSPSKEKEAKSFGADEFCTDKDLKNLTNSLDMILATAMADVDWLFYLSLLRPNGVLCMLGKPPSPLQIPAVLLTATQKIVTGSTVAPRHLMREMLQFAAERTLLPQIEKMPLSACNEAIKRVKQNKARYRIVLEINC